MCTNEAICVRGRTLRLLRNRQALVLKSRSPRRCPFILMNVLLAMTNSRLSHYLSDFSGLGFKCASPDFVGAFPICIACKPLYNKYVTINENERSNIYQWGCLAALLSGIALIIAAGIWLFTKPPASPPGIPSAIIQTVTLTASAPSLPIPTRLTLSNEIGIGVRVQISGTGNVGLSIRADASTEAERRAVAQEGDIFLITDGPIEADGLLWWYIKDEVDSTLVGWAAADYLTPVP